MELLRSLDSVRFQPFHQRTEISSIVGLEMHLRMSWDCSEKVKIQQPRSQSPSKTLGNIIMARLKLRGLKIG